MAFNLDNLVSLIIRSGPNASSIDGAHGAIAMTTNERITLDPAILAGKPVVRGTRLSVEFIIGLMADSWAEADILTNYPGLTHEDIAACLAYARDLLQSERVHPSAA